MTDAAQRIAKIWPLIVGILIIGVAGCAPEQQLPISDIAPPKIDHYTFSVSPGFLVTQTPEIVNVTTKAGDTIKVMFSVSGGMGNDVDFTMKNPGGGSDFDKLKVSKEFSKSFVVSSNGTYQLTFENNFSPFSTKTVNLTTMIYSK